MKRNFTTSKQNYKSIKTGFDTSKKYPDRPNYNYEPLSVKERTARHLKNHPNDKNEKKENKGVQWAKSRKTKRDNKLRDFYKTHVYSWISNTRRGWVAIPSEEEE